jgi:prephenate dehydrogenase
MKLNITAKSHLSLQTGLAITQAATQFLLPAFVHMTSQQHEAIAAFISAIQLYLGCTAIYTNPDGTPVSKEK